MENDTEFKKSKILLIVRLLTIFILPTASIITTLQFSRLEKTEEFATAYILRNQVAKISFEEKNDIVLFACSFPGVRNLSYDPFLTTVAQQAYFWGLIIQGVSENYAKSQSEKISNCTEYIGLKVHELANQAHENIMNFSSQGAVAWEKRNFLFTILLILQSLQIPFGWVAIYNEKDFLQTKEKIKTFKKIFNSKIILNMSPEQGKEKHHYDRLARWAKEIIFFALASSVVHRFVSVPDNFFSTGLIVVGCAIALGLYAFAIWQLLRKSSKNEISGATNKE